MSWTEMNVPNPIIVDAAGTAGSGYVLKAYLPGTTTTTSIAIDSSGSSPQSTITANAEGKWEVSGNEITPFIDRLHKWGIFASAAQAAANTPFYMGPFDNIPANVDAVGLSASGGSALVGYLPAGTGAVAETVQAELRKTHRSSNFATIGEANTAATGATLIIDSAVTVTASANWPENIVTRVEKGGSITINNGVTLGILGDFEAGLFKVFYYVGTGIVEFSSYKCPVLHPEWWGAQADNLTASAAANTTALLACNAAMPDSVPALQLGGTIQLPHGTMYITSWLFVGGDRVVKGHGQYATRLVGYGAGDYTMQVFDSGRCRFEDFQIDGGTVKTRAFQVLCTVGASSAGHMFNNVIFIGGVDYGLYVFGGPPGIYDLSSMSFRSCQFVGTSAIAQIYLSGDNTIAITFDNCIMYGASPYGVISGGAALFTQCNWGNNTLWSVQQNSGQFKCIGCHSEGTGGFLNTVASDNAGLEASQHVIIGHAGSNTGVNTSGMAIKHEAFRTLSISNSFFNENVEIDSGVFGLGVLDVWNNSFEAGSGYIMTEGKIQGLVDGSQVLPAGKSLKYNIAGTYQAAVGSAFIDVFASAQVVALSASDVNISSNGVGVYLLQNLTLGGNAFVWHVGGSTPVIMQSSGGTWVTAAPGANEVQVKDRGIGLGIAVRAHASTNNNQITCTRINAR